MAEKNKIAAEEAAKRAAEEERIRLEAERRAAIEKEKREIIEQQIRTEQMQAWREQANEIAEHNRALREAEKLQREVCFRACT